MLFSTRKRNSAMFMSGTCLQIINLIKIRSLTCSLLLICPGVRDLEKHKSHVSNPCIIHKRGLQDYGIATNYIATSNRIGRNITILTIALLGSPDLLSRDLSVKQRSYFAADHRLHLLTHTPTYT